MKQRLVLFGLLSFASLALALGITTTLPVRQLIIFTSYPVLALTFTLWILALFKSFRSGICIRGFLPPDRLSWVVCVLSAFFLLTLEPFAFKIVFDETLLSVSAEAMHFSRIAAFPQAANDYDGSYQFFLTDVDKRPFLFPFLLSLIHDLTGYRYSNVFYLNGFLTVTFVLLLFRAVRTIAGIQGARLAVLLTPTLGTLVTMTTSGHFELFNLCLLLLIFILGGHYMRTQSLIHLSALCLTIVIFLQVRYENAVYLPAFAGIVLYGWKRAGKPLLPVPVMLCPLLLVFPAVHTLFVLGQSREVFQAGPGGRENTFSIDYLGENFVAAINYFFSVDPFQSNSIALTTLGCVALVLVVAYSLRFLGGRNRSALSWLMLFFSLAVFSQVGTVLLFNYGLFDVHLTSRLSLPLQLLLLLWIPFAFKRYGQRAYPLLFLFIGLIGAFTWMTGSAHLFSVRGLRPLVAAVIFIGLVLYLYRQRVRLETTTVLLVTAFLLSLGLPKGHAHRYSALHGVNAESVMREIEFIKGHKQHEKILWISSSPYAAILTKTDAYPIVFMKADPSSIHSHLVEENYDHVYVVRRERLDDAGQFQWIESMDAIDRERFIMEPVETFRMDITIRLQVERLVQIETLEADASPTNRTLDPGT
jgi:hypothetical protein